MVSNGSLKENLGALFIDGYTSFDCGCTATGCTSRAVGCKLFCIDVNREEEAEKTPSTCSTNQGKQHFGHLVYCDIRIRLLAYHKDALGQRLQQKNLPFRRNFPSGK